jgi:hypothetical protein
MWKVARYLCQKSMWQVLPRTRKAWFLKQNAPGFVFGCWRNDWQVKCNPFSHAAYLQLFTPCNRTPPPPTANLLFTVLKPQKQKSITVTWSNSIHFTPSNTTQDPLWYHTPMYSYVTVSQVASSTKIPNPTFCVHCSFHHACYISAQCNLIGVPILTPLDTESDVRTKFAVM